MRQQLVDPFIPASGLARTAQDAPGQAVRQPVTRQSSPRARGVSIDGVMPAAPPIKRHRPSYRGPAPSLHLQYLPKLPSQQSTSRPQLAAPQQSVRQPELPPAPASSAQPVAAAVPKSAKHKRSKEAISTVWLVVGAAIAGLALFSVIAGQLAIAIYGLAALWRRWSSQQTFGLALVMVGGIIIASLLPPFRGVADNLAVYTFLLLCIGTVALGREVRRDMRELAD